MGRVRAYLRRNALALVALFIALSGAAWAAGLPRDSVSSRQLVDNAVKSRDVKDNGLRGPDVRESSLEQVPSAASADDAGPARRQPRERLPSVRLGDDPLRDDELRRLAGGRRGRRLPGPVRVRDRLAARPRSGAHPRAVGQLRPGNGRGRRQRRLLLGHSDCAHRPAGKVCLYLSESQNVDALGGYAVSNVGADNVFGFTVRATASSAGLVNADGSWAYTAP